MHKLAHKNTDKIIEAIQNKEKWYWIEYTYNCSASTISRIRKSLNKKAPLPKLTAEQRSEIIELRKKGLKLTEIASIFGVSDRYVSKLYLAYATPNKLQDR